MIRAVIAAVVVLIFSATTALSFQVLPEPADVSVAIDMKTAGNSATALGVEDGCISVNTGDTFDIDVNVKDVPPVQPDFFGPGGFAYGLAGYGYNLNFDPNVVHVVGAANNFKVDASAPFEFIIANYEIGADPAPLPATTGNMRVDFLDIGEIYEDGDGVLSRLTLEAVGAGTTTLHLDNDQEGQPAPIIFMAGGFPYGVAEMHDGIVNVGTPCDAASEPAPFDPEDSYALAYGLTHTPTPTPGPPTPTPTLGPSDVDEGDAKVSIDAITTGNTANSVDEIDDCASADVGDTFLVDIVIEAVEDFLGWEALVTYDPKVLKIVDHDVKLFLASASGSQVFDASNQTPNTTGFYRAGAVDQADPAAPDEGDGVLLRLTMEAVEGGTSKVSVSPADLNGDGQTDTGLLLKNTNNLAIGGAIFRGPTRDAEIRVGAECSDGGRVVATSAPSSDNPGEASDNGGSDTWMLIVAGVAVAVVAVGAGAALLMRRRKGGGTPA